MNPSIHLVHEDTHNKLMEIVVDRMLGNITADEYNERVTALFKAEAERKMKEMKA